jgi:hypothetical protein
MVVLTADVLEPVMGDCVAVDVPVYVLLAMPYWNNAVVVVPFVETVPLSIAELVVTLVAEPIVKAGKSKATSVEPDAELLLGSISPKPVLAETVAVPAIVLPPLAVTLPVTVIVEVPPLRV